MQTTICVSDALALMEEMTCHAFSLTASTLVRALVLGKLWPLNITQVDALPCSEVTNWLNSVTVARWAPIRCIPHERSTAHIYSRPNPGGVRSRSARTENASPLLATARRSYGIWPASTNRQNDSRIRAGLRSVQPLRKTLATTVYRQAARQIRDGLHSGVQPDGKTLASGGTDNTVRLSDIAMAMSQQSGRRLAGSDKLFAWAFSHTWYPWSPTGVKSMIYPQR